MSGPGGVAGAATAYARALALYQGGRAGEAEQVLRELLAGPAPSVEALQLMGIVVSAQGRVAESLAWLDQARARAPDNASVLHNRAQSLALLGRLAEARADLERAVALKADMQPAWNLLASVLASQGEREGAERAYRRALALRPANAETYYNFAIFCNDAGRIDEAIAGYRKALQLRAAFPEAHVNLANALKMKGRLDEAFAHYAEALRLRPEFPIALANYGTALREAGRAEEAIALLERAGQLLPQSESVWNTLGIAYFERGRFAEAVECYRRALELRPGFHHAHTNLGNALSALGRQDEAIASFRAAIALAPGEPEAHSNLAVTLQERGEIEAAIASYERALAIRPDYPDAINNLGYLLQEQGRRREAMALFRRVLDAHPGHARAEYNLALAHLAEFEFESGWKLHEARYRTQPPVAIARPFAIPAFSAADWGRGTRLAIWREQGVGDQLLYSTLLPELEACGQEFVLEVDARLVPAFQRAHPAWNVVAPEQSAAAFAGCDRHAAMGTLAGLLRPSSASFAGQPDALLAADPARAAAYRDRLHAIGTRPIGISWRSFQPSTRGYVERKKSAPLAAFKALSQAGDLGLLDLQYGDTAAEREAFAREGGRLARLEDLDLFKDLDGVMAAIAACDAVLTTSNVTAHLAGALGKRTLLVYLAANPPFHYWSTDADGRCLWYPSMRIVTGREIDTWDKALARAGALLRG